MEIPVLQFKAPCNNESTYDEYKGGIGCAVRGNGGQELGDLPVSCTRELARVNTRMEGCRNGGGGDGLERQ